MYRLIDSWYDGEFEFDPDNAPEVRETVAELQHLPIITVTSLAKAQQAKDELAKVEQAKSKLAKAEQAQAELTEGTDVDGEQLDLATMFLWSLFAGEEFSGELQERYPLRQNPGDESSFKKLELLTVAERGWNAARLRGLAQSHLEAMLVEAKKAQGLFEHADALAAYNPNGTDETAT